MGRKYSILKVYRALSNKTRRDIYALVLKKKMNITEISKELGISYHSTLKNLQLMEYVELIKREIRVGDKYKETIIIGVPFEKGSLNEEVYHKLLEEEEDGKANS